MTTCPGSAQRVAEVGSQIEAVTKLGDTIQRQSNRKRGEPGDKRLHAACFK